MKAAMAEIVWEIFTWLLQAREYKYKYKVVLERLQVKHWRLFL